MPGGIRLFFVWFRCSNIRRFTIVKLEAAGAKIENTIKTTVFIKNMDDFTKVNEIYAKYFTTDFPARSCVEVARLPKDVLIEIEAIVEK